MLATTVARPYAKAVFELAIAQDNHAVWVRFLQKLSAICESPDVRKILVNPLLGTDKQCQWLKKACGDVLFAEAERLLWQLADKRRLLVVPEVFELYRAMHAAKEQKLRAHCVSFMPLSQDDQDKLASALKRHFSQEVIIDQVTEDQQLLGGVIIKIGDRVIDGSLRGKLNRLRQQLMASKGN